MTPRSPSIIRTVLVPVLSTVGFLASNAQVLFVNDNDNITYNTDTLLNDLAAAGIVYDVYDIPTSGGVPPSAALMDGYDKVIWYCSTDGVDLGFWSDDGQLNIIDRILNGKKIWIIGQDLIYSAYGVAPIAFDVGDFPTDFMGIASYDVQSYGDDGNVGCPGMVVDAGVSGSFSAGFGWVFSTLWWVDGVTPTSDATAIYAMGPAPYVLEGAISMLHFHPPGMNVMSTLFDPALIDTFDARKTFLQETLAYMDLDAGVPLLGTASAALHLSQNPAIDHVEVGWEEAIGSITLYDARGMVVLRTPGVGRRNMDLDLRGLAGGAYQVSAVSRSGRRAAAVLVKE